MISFDLEMLRRLSILLFNGQTFSSLTGQTSGLPKGSYENFFGILRRHPIGKEIQISPHRASRSPEVRLIRRETAAWKIASFPQTSTIVFALVIAV